MLCYLEAIASKKSPYRHLSLEVCGFLQEQPAQKVRKTAPRSSHFCELKPWNLYFCVFCIFVLSAFVG